MQESLDRLCSGSFAHVAVPKLCSEDFSAEVLFTRQPIRTRKKTKSTPHLNPWLNSFALIVNECCKGKIQETFMRANIKATPMKPKELPSYYVILAAAVWFLWAATLHAAQFIGQTTFGGAANETGAGVFADSSGVYFVGDGPGGSIVGLFPANLGPTPIWSRTGAADSHTGITGFGAGIFTAGYSQALTSDIVGDKERKGLTANYNATGVSGSAAGGAVWIRQTPAAPGGFPYGGIEGLTGIASITQAGQPFLYTAGLGERQGFTPLWGTFVTKLDLSGNVLWSRNDNTPTHFLNTPAIVGTNDAVYLATRSDSSGAHPYLKKYDGNGNLVWSRTSMITGEYRGITAGPNNVIYAVGQAGSGPTGDFLIESWDANGNLLWSKTFDRNRAEDVLNGVIVVNGHVLAVGATRGNTSGGSDGILLDIDPFAGNLLDSVLWGGAANDLFAGIASDGSRLFAVGTTSSFGAGGSDIALASFLAPSSSSPVPEPAAALLVAVGLAGFGVRKLRTVRKKFYR